MNTGTVIHGTLLTYDLIEAFVSELEDQSVGINDPEQGERVKRLIIEANDVCADGLTWGKDSINYPDNPDTSQRLGDLTMDLMDALSEFAPEGYYFGAHVGDGADFGYWPVEDFDA